MDRYALRLILAFALLGRTLTSTGAMAAKAPVLPPGDQPCGHTYGEWAAAWSRWALSQPASKNPILDSNGAFCANEQDGEVWFLAGSLRATINGISVSDIPTRSSRPGRDPRTLDATSDDRSSSTRAQDRATVEKHRDWVRRLKLGQPIPSAGRLVEHRRSGGGVVGLAPDVLAGEPHRAEPQAPDLEVAEPEGLRAGGKPQHGLHDAPIPPGAATAAARIRRASPTAASA
jgi:hypothetical protein